MAERFPAMNIYFPPRRESELHEEMNRLAQRAWSPQDHDAFNRPPKDGNYYFHRVIVDECPSFTLCIDREKAGHWIVRAIVPDEGQHSEIPLETYKAILNEFETLIAGPAVEVVEGMTGIELSHYRLEDYFSQKTVGLLETFCQTSNGLGSHPNDQEKWLRFLIAAYDDGSEVHCDVFGWCLKTAEWWPIDDIRRLVREYDFAMCLLQQTGRKRNT